MDGKTLFSARAQLWEYLAAGAFDVETGFVDLSASGLAQQHSTLLPLDAARQMSTFCTRSEAAITHEVDGLVFDGVMLPIATSPVPTEMTQLPRIVDKTSYLGIGKAVIDEERHNALIDPKLVVSKGIIPTEVAFDAPWGCICCCPGRPRMEPTVATRKRSTKDDFSVVDTLIHHLFHLVGWVVYEQMLAFSDGQGVWIWFASLYRWRFVPQTALVMGSVRRI